MSCPSKEAVIAAMQGRVMEIFSPLELKRCGNDMKALCPFHEERTPSFSINPVSGLWHCFGCQRGGNVFDYVMTRDEVDFPEALRRLWEKFGVSAKPSAPVSKIIGYYDYTDEEGIPLYQVVRREPKGFSQRRPNGKGGWVNNMKEVRLVLYRLPQVRDAVQAGATIFIVEGEKDSDRLSREGLTEACNPMGAGKWKDTFNSALKGAHVVILPDNDEPGQKHAQSVAEAISGTAASIKVVNLPGLAEKGDVSDWLNQGGTVSALQEICQTSPAWKPKLQQADAQTIEKPAGPRISRRPKLQQEVLYGLAGDFVRAIEPHTEADPAALLIQFLTAFGSVIGRSGHFVAESDKHFYNLYAVLVGQSSKARKGTSWGYILRIFDRVEPAWVEQNIASGLSSGEGLIHAVRNTVEKDVKDKNTGQVSTEVIDPGVEDKKISGCWYRKQSSLPSSG